MIFTFVLLCYNQEVDIINGLNSIISSGIPESEYEIIVSDDGSTDDSVKNILALNKNNITVITRKENTRNQSLCRNDGIRIAKGKYVLFLDGDDIFNNKALYKLYEYMLDNKIENDIVFTPYIKRELNETNVRYIANNREDFMNGERIAYGMHCYIVKNDYLKRSGMLFDEVVHTFYSEDFLFNFLLFDNTDDYLFLKDFEWLRNYFIASSDNNSYDKSDISYSMFCDIALLLEKVLKKKHLKESVFKVFCCHTRFCLSNK